MLDADSTNCFGAPHPSKTVLGITLTFDITKNILCLAWHAQRGRACWHVQSGHLQHAHALYGIQSVDMPGVPAYNMTSSVVKKNYISLYFKNEVNFSSHMYVAKLFYADKNMAPDIMC